MPQYCSKKYYDMYPNASDIALPTNPSPPRGVPQVAIQTSAAFRKWVNSPTAKGPCVTSFDAWNNSNSCYLGDDITRTMRRSYYACVTQTDALVGRVLAALAKSGFESTTAVVLWGDHGWHLGELAQWAKYTNFEHGTRIPFILHDPRAASQQLPALRVAALVESVDIYPTIAEVAGLPPPGLCASSTDQTAVCVEGVSVVPHLQQMWGQGQGHGSAGVNVTPAGGAGGTGGAATTIEPVWKAASFSQFPRPDRGVVQVDGMPPFNTSGNGKEAVMG
jgi:arylsulfatase A-like enzyme